MSTLTTRPARVKPVPPVTTDAPKKTLDPLPAGFITAFRTGDVAGVRAAADWYRDRERPETAADFDILAFEVEAACVEARQVRHVLNTIDKPKPNRHRRWLKYYVERFLEEAGLPVLVRGGEESFILMVPNDGEHGDALDRLAVLVTTAFPQAEFFVVADNAPRTDRALRAVNLLYQFRPRKPTA